MYAVAVSPDQRAQRLAISASPAAYDDVITDDRAHRSASTREASAC